VIDFTIPETISPTDYPINLTTSSSEEGESVKTASTLSVTKARTGLDFGVYDTRYYTTSEGGNEIIVYVTVRNTGSTALKNVRPTLSGYAVLAQPSFLNLAPGESKSMLLSVSVPKSSTGTLLPLLMKSGDGTQSNTLSLPASPEKPPEETKAGSTWVWYAFLALIILVLGIIYLIKKERSELD
jgi:uncharacterized membrane protein